MEAVGELAGGVAHNFNNLLTGILGSIALVQDALPPADPLREDLNLAETAARQAADLTRGLLAFSRSAVIIPKPMCINDAVETALTMLHQSLPPTTGVVRDFEQSAWNALLDQAQMTQIVVTLGIHARDAMDGKGTISVTTRNVVIESEYVRTHPSARAGDHVLLCIADTGPGLAPEVLEHLFEPFFTTTLKRPAAGLGLSIVYGAVKQLGGWIDVTSRPGEGTAFDIYLPRSTGSAAQRQRDPASRPQPKYRGTILVVEDEPVVSSVTQALLTRSGYTVLVAAEGNSAIDIVRRKTPDIDLILLDMTMPGPSMDEITRSIRAIDVHVPILLNSGYTSDDAVRRMLDEGTVQGFLGKPYELHELLDAINRLMKRL
jgi:CheY-like chemotaxis protein